jgi:hypothetical protein
MTIEIEKDVPIPTACGRGRPTKYPFAEMEVGDSFAVPLAGESYGRHSGDKAAASLSRNSHTYGKKHGKTFTVRQLNDEGVARVWRVS